MMPGKNGVESFIEIRRLRPTAKVFMMTGYSVEELLAQAVREGAMGYLEKPFDPHEVLRLTTDVGKGGLLVALPAAPQHEVGDVIENALRSHGRNCTRIRDEAVGVQSIAADQVLIFDAPMPLIDAVSSYQSMRRTGNMNTTIIVPQDSKAPVGPDDALADVSVTGILNKPFDPLDLINKLPLLAA
jgi:CheY-like chemotaxis protein